MIQFVEAYSDDENHINYYNPFTHKQQKWKSNFLSLSDPSNIVKIFKYIPRTFEIKTNNGSCYFNTMVLKDISYTIGNFLDSNPDSREYHLSVDSNVVLKKIEELCQGIPVYFLKEELSELEEIINFLNINSLQYLFSNFTEHKRNKTGKINLKIYSDCENIFLIEEQAKIIISTNKKEYVCNINGACTSEVIRKFISENPNTDLYKYDYDDKMDEFQKISDFFNFREVPITVDDIESLQKIAEDLKIDIILNTIKKIYVIQDKFFEKIDKNQEIIDHINELFDWLYQIKKLSVEKVTNLIIHSRWSKTEEEVQELAAFIIQVIKTDKQLHDNFIDLLFQLDSKGSNELKILIPFLKEKIINIFSNDVILCSFVYKMYHKGIISKEELIIELKKNCNTCKGSLHVWFLPELIEIDCCDLIYLKSNMKNSILFFLPDKIDLYKEIRDSGEPYDKLAKAIKNDDIDTVQSIISESLIKDFSKYSITPCIFELFDQNSISYINYSAAYGSVKCFKYFMLNHSKIDSITFKYAFYSGNIEIIKIVDNYLHQNNSKNDNGSYYYYNNYNHFNSCNININILISLIKNHKNNLFDWFIEQKIQSKDLLSDYVLNDIINDSVSNGNIHALIAFIDKGINIFENKEITSLAAVNGFYLLLRFLYDSKIQEKNIPEICSSSHESQNYVTFGNLSIFKLYIEAINKKDKSIDTLLSYAIEKNQTKMINYFFNEQSDKISILTIKAVLEKSLEKSNELFYYFIDKFKDVVPLLFENYSYDSKLLEIACKYNRIKPFYSIMNSEKISLNTNFTNCLFMAATSNSIEMCNYLIDQKLSINYASLIQKIAYVAKISREVILLIFNKSGLEISKSLLLPLLNPAIKSHNQYLVDFICEKNIFYDECLINAVSALDIDIINIILKYKSDPSFINRVSSEGTALHIAVSKNKLEIVKKLISIPSIKLCLYDRNGQTPFMIASKQSDFPIIKELIPIIGKDILLYRDSIECLLDALTRGISRVKTEIFDQWIEILEIVLNIENISMFFIGRNQKYFIDICFNKNVKIEIVQKFLKNANIDVNNISPLDGNSLLNLALKNQRFDIAELLINDPKTDINLTNYNHEGPLIIAVQKNQASIVKLLINNEKFDPYVNGIETAIIKSNDDISEIILSSNLIDINFVPVNPNSYSYSNRSNWSYNSCTRNESILVQAAKNQKIKTIELIIKHPNFDKEKSDLQKAISIMFSTNNTEAKNSFLKILFENGLITIDYCIKNPKILNVLLHNASNENIKELFNNDLVISDEDILKVFDNSLISANNSVIMMEFLLNYDKKHHNVIDIKKNSYFTKISLSYGDYGRYCNTINKNMENVEKIVNFINQNGGDVNKQDKFGRYPLEYAIISCFSELVQALLNTNKINYNQIITKKNDGLNMTVEYDFMIMAQDFKKGKNRKIQTETYLHLAAKYNSDIFNMLLNCNGFDINAKDSDYNTPLMLACECFNRSVIELLFKKDNLDFHCRNSKNQDALDIIHFLLDDVSDTNVSNDNLTKEQYFDKLMTEIDKHESSNSDDDN